jgi:hypothetical protein
MLAWLEPDMCFRKLDPWGTLSNVVPFGFNVAFPLVHIGIAKALH